MTKVYVIPRRATRDQILSSSFQPPTPLQSTNSNKASRKELEYFQGGIIVDRFLGGQEKAD